MVRTLISGYSFTQDHDYVTLLLYFHVGSHRSLAFTLITPSDLSVSLFYLIAQDHDGTVIACSFSSDDKLAVSCSATETWVWQAFAPVHRLYQLHPASGAGGRTT